MGDSSLFVKGDHGFGSKDLPSGCVDLFDPNARVYCAECGGDHVAALIGLNDNGIRLPPVVSVNDFACPLKRRGSNG
jgi:hypothetical protein